jgi:hypothetical protein
MSALVMLVTSRAFPFALCGTRDPTSITSCSRLLGIVSAAYVSARPPADAAELIIRNRAR